MAMTDLHLSYEEWSTGEPKPLHPKLEGWAYDPSTRVIAKGAIRLRGDVAELQLRVLSGWVPLNLREVFGQAQHYPFIPGRDTPPLTDLLPALERVLARGEKDTFEAILRGAQLGSVPGQWERFLRGRAWMLTHDVLPTDMGQHYGDEPTILVYGASRSIYEHEKAREMLEQAGFVFGEATADPLFVHGTLPEGWTKRVRAIPDQETHVDLHDAQGRCRGFMKYIPKEYDRKAHISLLRRYYVTSEDYEVEGSPYGILDRTTGKVIEVEPPEEKHSRFIYERLLERFPDDSPLAYWDD